MRNVKRWFVVVKYTTVFGDEKEAEIPCTSKSNMEKTLKELHYQFKYDPIISTFKVIPIYRQEAKHESHLQHDDQPDNCT